MQDRESKFQTGIEPLAEGVPEKALSKGSGIFDAFSTISSAFCSISTRYKIVSFCQENSSECSDAIVSKIQVTFQAEITILGSPQRLSVEQNLLLANAEF